MPSTLPPTLSQPPEGTGVQITILAPGAAHRWARLTPLVGTLLPGLALALVAGTIAAARGFDGLYGQDAYAYFDYSTQSVRQSLLHLQPLESFFWPPGYPLLVALASFVFGPVPLAGQFVSLVMGALVPVLTVLLVRELFPSDPPLAWLAGAIVGVSGQLWQSSVVVMADTTGLALATVAAVALARYASRARGTWLVAASAAIAYATLARWIYGIVAVPFAAYALWTLWKRRRVPAEALLAVLVAAVILGPILAAPLVNLARNPNEPAAFAGNLQVYSWSPVNALRRDFFTADGHLEYSLPNGMYYAIAPGNLAFFGPLLALALLPGVWAARTWPPQTALLIVGWAVSVYAFHAGAPWQNFRFTLAYLPPVGVLAAAGILLGWRRMPDPWGTLVLGLALVGLALATLGAARLVERFIDTKDQELALVHWTQSEVPPDAQLFTFGPTLAFRHYSALPTFDLFDLSRADVDAVLRQPSPHVVLVDEHSLASQWHDQAPEVNFAHLRQVGIERLGTSGSYTLYRVSVS